MPEGWAWSRVRGSLAGRRRELHFSDEPSPRRADVCQGDLHLRGCARRRRGCCRREDGQGHASWCIQP